MALAYGSIDELSHQLRFLLFEIGIGLHQQQIEHYICVAHKECLQTLQQSARAEGFMNSPLPSHHVHDFLEQLKQKLKATHPASRFFAWDTLYHHCNETIANNALAAAYKTSWNNRLCQELHPFPSLWAWLQQQSAAQSFTFLEQWGSRAPTLESSWYKLKDYTRREVLQYSPEFQAQFCIHWLAISKKAARVTPAFNERIKQEFAREYAAWQDKLHVQHLNSEEYLPLPIHPWLWRSMQNYYASMLDDKSLILVPHHQKIMPAMTTDKLMPLQATLHLKYTNEAECAVQQKLHCILAQEHHYDDSLLLIKQSDAVISHANNNTPCLGVRLLQNPSSLLRPQQRAIPLLSLFSQSPLTNTCLIDELIKESNLAPLNYFIHYCHKIMFGPLHLFFKHGLSFSTTPEETSIVIEHHLPRGLILGELHHCYLPETAAQNATSELVEKLLEGLLHHNIRYWIEHFSQNYQLESAYLWAQVGQIIDSICTQLEGDVLPQVEQEQKHLLCSELKQSYPILTHYLIPHYSLQTGAIL